MPISFDAKRKAEMAAYAERHYGIGSYRLRNPQVIVEHYTANDSIQATYDTFAKMSRTPNSMNCPRSVSTSRWQ